MGLGKGVYYKSKIPWPDHVGGLCYLSPVLPEPEDLATAQAYDPDDAAAYDAAIAQIQGPLAKQANRLGRRLEHDPTLQDEFERLIEQPPTITPKTLPPKPYPEPLVPPELPPVVPVEPPPGGRPISVGEAEQRLDTLPRVGVRGRPRPDGEFLRTDEFFPLANEDLMKPAEARLETLKPAGTTWSDFYRQHGQRVDVALDTLLGSYNQPTVKLEKVREKLQGIVEHSSELPIVLRLENGQLAILDGHHRLVAEYVQGQLTAEVLVIDVQLL